ncbi:MAG TPA: site-specific integrase [Acidimicrobiales bacterium]|nr:site-specific integrase [Acidimicrobiales bacterium]
MPSRSRLPQIAGTQALTQALTEQALELHAARRADSTRRAYDKDWALFEEFCAEIGATPLPAAPLTVAQFIAGHTLLTPPAAASTIDRRLAAIRARHVDAGFPSPTADPAVVGVRSGARRTIGVRPKRQVDALTTDDIRQLVKPIDNSLIGRRDRALLLVGFAGAFRRSELVAVEVDHLYRDRRGYRILVPESKTDQEGEGLDKGIPHGKGITCPVTALDRWLRFSGINQGPVFRAVDQKGRISSTALTDQSVALIIKRRAKAAGLTDEAVARLAGHSLRAGNVTTLAREGVPFQDIMKLTGHKNERTVLRYVRQEDVLGPKATAKKLGL